MYSLVFTAKADAQLGKLDPPVKERIVAALQRLRFQPRAHLKKLVGEEGYRFRVGDYRVVVDIIENKLVVLVLRVARRSVVYDR